MIQYFLRRIVHTIIVLVVLSFAVYGSMALMPGDPIELLITSNPRVKPEDVERLKKLKGLDKPIPVRYVKWLKEVIIDRDLGYSRTYSGTRTWDLVKDKIPNSL